MQVLVHTCASSPTSLTLPPTATLSTLLPLLPTPTPVSTFMTSSGKIVTPSTRLSSLSETTPLNLYAVSNSSLKTASSSLSSTSLSIRTAILAAESQIAKSRTPPPPTTSTSDDADADADDAATIKESLLAMANQVLAGVTSARSAISQTDDLISHIDYLQSTLPAVQTAYHSYIISHVAAQVTKIQAALVPAFDQWNTVHSKIAPSLSSPTTTTTSSSSTILEYAYNQNAERTTQWKTKLSHEATQLSLSVPKLLTSLHTWTTKADSLDPTSTTTTLPPMPPLPLNLSDYVQDLEAEMTEVVNAIRNFSVFEMDALNAYLAAHPGLAKVGTLVLSLRALAVGIEGRVTRVLSEFYQARKIIVSARDLTQEARGLATTGRNVLSALGESSSSMQEYTLLASTSAEKYAAISEIAVRHAVSLPILPDILSDAHGTDHTGIRPLLGPIIDAPLSLPLPFPEDPEDNTSSSLTTSTVYLGESYAVVPTPEDEMVDLTTKHYQAIYALSRQPPPASEAYLTSLSSQLAAAEAQRAALAAQLAEARATSTSLAAQLERVTTDNRELTSVVASQKNQITLKQRLWDRERAALNARISQLS